MASAEWWQEFFLSGSYTLLEDIPDELTGLQVAFAERALGFAPGRAARVLDVACGVGRHSLALAARGVRVTGIDYAPDFLRRAMARRGDLPARFVRSDMRALPFANEAFDAAICLFNSLGYFDTPGEDARTLGEIARVLAPGGRLLLDVLHRDGIARSFAPERREPFAGGHVEETRTWNARTGQITSHWTFHNDHGGPPKTLTTINRVYTCSEMERMLGAAGFTVENIWGSWGGAPLTLSDHAMIFQVQKQQP